MKKQKLITEIMRNVAFVEIREIFVRIFLFSLVLAIASVTIFLAINQTFTDLYENGLGELVGALKYDSEIIGFFLSDLQTLFLETYSPLALGLGLLSGIAVILVLIKGNISKLIQRFKKAYPYIQKA